MGSDTKSNGGSVLPARVKKLVQGLREVVDYRYTDAEISAVLEECDMDADEAAQRLLAQDTFQEVRSKRERRKELKEKQELRTWGYNCASVSGGRIANGHVALKGRGSQSSCNELGKATYGRENSSVAESLHSSSIPFAVSRTAAERPSRHSSVNGDTSRQLVGMGDFHSFPSNQASAFQPDRSVDTLGHVSMADIVKMGASKSKSFKISTDESDVSQNTIGPTSSQIQSKSVPVTAAPAFQGNQIPQLPEPCIGSEIKADGDGFAIKESVSGRTKYAPASHTMETSAATISKVHERPSNLYSGRASMSRNSQTDKDHVSEEDFPGKNLSSEAASGVVGQITVNETLGADNDGHFLSHSSYDDSSRREHECREATSMSGISKAVSSLQELSLGIDEPATADAEKRVVLPDHHQDFTAVCSHLSFGTLRFGKSSEFSSQLASGALRNEICGSLDYKGCEELESVTVALVTPLDGRNCNSSINEQAESVSLQHHEANGGSDHVFASSDRISDFNSIQQPTSSLAFLTGLKTKNLPPVPSELDSSSKFVPIDLLEPTTEYIKQIDPASSATQSNLVAYGSALPSGVVPTAASMTELSSQPLPIPNLAATPELLQHLSANAYSQLGRRGTHSNYSYAPPVQQIYLDNFNQSRDLFNNSRTGFNDDLSHSIRGVGVSGLPVSNPNSVYGNLGVSTNMLGSLHQEMSAASIGANAVQENVFRTQFREGNFSPTQSNPLAAWNYGFGSRTTPGVPDGSFYSLLGQQTQQRGGYEQSLQTLLQQNGALGYASPYSESRTMQGQPMNRLFDSSQYDGFQRPSPEQLRQRWNPRY